MMHSRDLTDRPPPHARIAKGVLCGLVLLSVSTPAGASSRAERRIDPQLRGAEAYSKHRVSAVVRLEGLDARTQADLEAEGVIFERATSGGPRHLGDLYPLTAPKDVLARLAPRHSVSVARVTTVAPTIFQTADEVQAFDMWANSPTPLPTAEDERQTVLVVDAGIDIFHPHFFRTDAGAWTWVDVDEDGTLTPGVDGVDTNGDGDIEANEVLQLLDYTQHSWSGELETENNGEFETYRDYLYLDRNGNGGRDFGPIGGYTEDMPGYGEPMFVPDDADGNTQLSVDEKVLLLGTSQVRAYRSGDGTVWERGVDLINAPQTLPQHHGSAVSGIVTGGQTLPFRTTRGLLPDADILTASFYTNTDAQLVSHYAWGAEMGATIANHSYGTFNGGEFRDGTGLLAAALDAATDEGVLQACSAGNGWQVDHHAQQVGMGPMRFDVDMGSPMTDWFTLDLFWFDPTVELACEVTSPAGEVIMLGEGDQDVSGTTVGVTRVDSERDTAMLSIRVDADEVAPGDWTGLWGFSCTHDGDAELEVHGVLEPTHNPGPLRMADPVRSHQLHGVASSDSCIISAAYAFNIGTSGPGNLESYSSQGPRIGGPARTVDIAGPIDAFPPFSSQLGGSSYALFSGTSSASPHVAGIAGLIRAHDPSLTPAEVRDLIREAAERDDNVTNDADAFPDDRWGMGKLRGYRAITGEDPPPRPEVLALSYEVEYTYDEGGCRASVVMQDVDWSEPSFRWDAEYDGVWDTGFEPALEYAVMLDEPGDGFNVRVDGASRGWIIGGASIVGVAPTECFEPPPEGTSSGGDMPDSDGDDPAPGTSGTSGDAPETGGTSDGDPDADGSGDDGCACRGGGTPGSAVLLFGVLAFIRRRR